MMRITKKSPVTGALNTMKLDITPYQYTAWKEWGYLIQDVMPELSSDEREFLISGATQEDLYQLYGTCEEFK